MIRRRALILAGLLIPPGVAAAQTTPATPARPAAPRRRARRPPPPPPEPPPAPVSRGDPAPVPNPDIEAPRSRGDAPAARIDPALIDPNVPRAGVSGAPQGPPAREDRLLRQPGAGARLRVPFAY